MRASVTLLLHAASLLLLLDSAAGASNKTMQCYFCYEATEVKYCNEIKNCAPGITHCHTITQGSNTGYPFISGDFLVTRDCSRRCVNSDPGALGSERDIFCCEETLCNRLYEEFANFTEGLNSTGYGLHHGATYGGVAVGVSLISLLFPSWL